MSLLLRLSYNEAKVLETVLAHADMVDIPAHQSIDLIEIQRQLDIVLAEYYYERSCASRD